jgi:hypothetical protein
MAILFVKVPTPLSPSFPAAASVLLDGLALSKTRGAPKGGAVLKTQCGTFELTCCPQERRGVWKVRGAKRAWAEMHATCVCGCPLTRRGPHFGGLLAAARVPRRAAVWDPPLVADRDGRAQIAKPSEVRRAEQASDMSEEETISLLTDYQIAVHKYAKVLRQLLHRYNGYECKEPEPGKFTLAFRCGRADG